MLRGVHTADLGAILLSAAGGIAASHALYEHNGMRVGFVGRAQQRTAGRTRRIHQAFVFKRGNNVGTLRIGELVVVVELYGIEAGRGDDGAIFFLDNLVLL